MWVPSWDFGLFPASLSLLPSQTEQWWSNTCERSSWGTWLGAQLALSKSSYPQNKQTNKQTNKQKKPNNYSGNLFLLIKIYWNKEQDRYETREAKTCKGRVWSSHLINLFIWPSGLWTSPGQGSDPSCNSDLPRLGKDPITHCAGRGLNTCPGISETFLIWLHHS